jgi:DNA-binding NarL/FixJ family response regulator
MISLLVVDDEPIFRQGLVALLSLEKDFQIKGQAADGRAAIRLAEQLQPDIVLMDMRMPICDGVEATDAIHQRYPWMKILVLSTFDEDEYIQRSLQAGALGYILKNTPSGQIADAIRMLSKGYTLLGQTIAPKIVSRMQPSLSRLPPVDFTERERNVLALLAQGKSNREIAAELYLTEATVKKYMSRILLQLNLRDRTQAALWAQRHFIS